MRIYLYAVILPTADKTLGGWMYWVWDDLPTQQTWRLQFQSTCLYGPHSQASPGFFLCSSVWIQFSWKWKSWTQTEEQKWVRSWNEASIMWCWVIPSFLGLLLSFSWSSGGFRNVERGAQSENFGLPRPLPVVLAVRTEYLEATLALVKRLEISKELIRERISVPGCCCMPLLHKHLMDSCSYVRKNTFLAAKGGCKCTPLTPPGSATVEYLYDNPM